MDQMRKRYGEESLDCLHVWSEKFGFPVNGSFSTNQLSQLRKKLMEQESDLRGKKKVNMKDLEMVEKHKKCFELWNKESDRRERSRLQKVLKSEPEKCQDEEIGKCPPYMPAHTHSHMSSALYPQLSATRLRSDLDFLPSCPPSAPRPDHTQSQRQPPPLREALLQPQKEELSSPTNRTRSGQMYGQGKSTSVQAADSTTPVNRRAENTPLPPDSDDELSAFPVQNYPMVEVAGHDGPTMVFRPWTVSDVREASSHLPDVTTSGEAFAEALIVFCREFRPTLTELRRLLGTKMKATDFAKISNILVGDDIRCAHIEYGHADNAQYARKVTDIATVIKTAFPTRLNMSAIAACKQRPDEGTDDYLHRLTEVFTTHSGIARPNNTDQMTPWETHLCSAFLNGLLPEIAAAVKLSCVCYEEARLDELRRHSRHNQAQLMAKKQQRTIKAEKELHQATLTLLQTASQQHGGKGGFNKKGRKGEQGRGKGDNKGRHFHKDPDACFKCGEKGHWARDCPNKRGEKNEFSHRKNSFHSSD